MNNITRVGVDLAKSLIQVHAVDAAGKVVTNCTLKREKFLLWCRQLCQLGLDACMIPAQFVEPYRIQGKSGKNDAIDAAASPHVFVDLVVPDLQKRGLCRKAYEGKTLRENLGLDGPLSRYTEPSAQAA